ncbi:hypothetical protein P4B35_23820 [Pontiellaceae bacterium B12227]|nr:hypothetical protein [Pontiellaceae bacterium B12227]
MKKPRNKKKRTPREIRVWGFVVLLSGLISGFYFVPKSYATQETIQVKGMTSMEYTTIAIVCATMSIIGAAMIVNSFKKVKLKN